MKCRMYNDNMNKIYFGNIPLTIRVGCCEYGNKNINNFTCKHISLIKTP